MGDKEKRNSNELELENGSPKKMDDQYRSYDTAIDRPVELAKNKDENGDGKKKDEPKVPFLQLFRYASSLDVLLLIIGIISAIASGLAFPGLALVFGQLLDTFICGQSIVSNSSVMTIATTIATTVASTNSSCSSNSFNSSCNFDGNDPSAFEDTMETVAIRFAIIGFGVWITMYIYVAFLSIAAQRQTRRMREAFFRAIMRQEIGWFDTSDTGELATRMADDLDKVFAGIGDKIGILIQWLTTFFGGLLVGFISEWRLALLILGFTPLLAIVAGAISKLIVSYTTREQKAYAQAGSVAEEVISCVRTVVAFGGEEKEAERYKCEVEKARQIGNKKAMTSGLVLAVTFLVIFGIYAVGFWFAGYLIRKELTSGGKALTTFFAVIMGAFSLGHAAPNIEIINSARGAALRVFAIEDRISKIDPMSEEGEKPDDKTIKGNIEFKNVQFTYPARSEAEVLKGVTLKVGCGQTMALVGPSGCGKSTVVQLIQRYYDPDQGQVLLDGHDLKGLNVHWLRERIGVVSQEPVLFATSIKENVRYGRLDVTDEEIMVAAKAANAHDFIMNLPQKYDTLVGERGAQLSGGQKQRVAIARALVRNPKVLLLDEATSALDTESEKIVQDALDKAREGRTTIVIAHRLSTVRNATTISSILSGKIVEQGNHDELMARKDVYYELVMNQSVGDGSDETEKKAVSPTKKKTFASAYHRQISRQASHQSSGTGYGRQESSSKNVKGAEMGEEEDEEEEEAPPSLPPVLRVIKFNAPEWPYLVLGTIGAAAAGVVMPAFALIFARILRVFSLDCDEMEAEVAVYAPVFFYIGIGSAIFEFSKSFFFGYAGEMVTARLRGLAFRAMLRQEMSWFDDKHHSTGALTTRLAKDASEVKGGLGFRLAVIVQLISTVVAALGISFYYNWQMTLVTLSAMPLLIISGFLQMKALAGHGKDDKERMEESGKVAVEAIDNIRTVAQLGREETFWKNYHDCLEGPYKRSLSQAHVQGVSFGFSQAIMFFAYAGAFRFGAWQVVEQGVDYESVFIVFGAIVFGAFSMGQAMSFAPEYSKTRLAAARICQLLDAVPSIDSSSDDGMKPRDIDGVIKFGSTKFNYPTRPDVRVLDGMDISVESGQTVALVGSSGCGKSTCIQLLERFYDVADGAVSMDGHDIREWNVSHLRRQFGLVSQEPILFDCSIRKNIAYGDNTRDIPQEEIEKAAKSANIHQFIKGLPNGYETGVGDKGTQLSGGQKQRIAIARALIRNPKVLLLDEATSALDTESEKIVQEALDRAREGRTSIVIAHRLSTIQNADQIFVIQNGRVVEKGTHGELMKREGVYLRLNKAQVRQN
eukprot:m.241042 g.241042  ORF g.241042 m.241042 type:complete len:1331 (+) comp40199_c0_seq19:2286-6278(+)